MTSSGPSWWSVSKTQPFPEPPAEKRCPKCETTKPRGEFHRARASRDGLKSWCVPCCNVHEAERRRLLRARRSPRRPIEADDAAIDALLGNPKR